MGDLSTGAQPSEKSPENRLDSWKEIATYVKRDITTVQRWEKREGMPVHRHLHDKRGSVYAYSSELDAWIESRRLRLEQEEETAEESAPTDPETRPRQAWHIRRWAVAAGIILFAVVAVGFAIRYAFTIASRPKITSIAVLPLKNLSGDAAQEYLVDGMTEAVIGRLSMISGLRVISRTSVMQFKDTRRSAPDIAQTLHVDALVEGSVIREGSRVRVHAQLIRGATDEHFWSESYDRDMSDVLALQRDVAQAIAEKVEVTVTGQEHTRLVAARHVAPEVYESYLKGRSGMNNSRAEVEQSIAYFQDAIKKDPTFAPAYVGLAYAYDGLDELLIGARPDEAPPKLISAAQKALELDPGLSDPHTLLADVYQRRWQWANAEAEYKRALELNPNDPAAHLGLADWLLHQGRMEEALEWSHRARELDPLGVSGLSNGWILFHERRYEESIRELRTVVAVYPEYATAHWFLGYVLIANNQPEEAITPLNKALSLSDNSSGVIGTLIRAYAQAGHRSEALRLLDDLKQRQREGYVSAAAFVDAYLGLGDREQAFAWLERAYKEQSEILQLLKVHPFFDPLRDDPRFKDLLRRVGLAQ